MLISEESYDRVQSAVDDISVAVDIDDEYGQWYDVATSCVTDCFEDLEDNQIETTVEAWIERIEKESGENENLAKGYANALLLSLSEMLENKERFILECNIGEDDGGDEYDDDDDEYDEHEAVAVKKAFEDALERVREVLSEYLD